VGDFRLGIPARNVVDAVLDAGSRDVAVAAHYPQVFEYCFRDALHLYLDIVRSRLIRIDLADGFLGEYQGIHVGSTVSEMQTVMPDLSWDEDWVIAGPDYALAAQLDIDGVVGGVDEVLDERIQLLSMEMKNWRYTEA
jgi:hypothetical protein